MFKKVFVTSSFLVLLLSGCNTEKEVKEQQTVQAESRYPITIDSYTYDGTKIEQQIKKTPENVMVIGSSVAELMVKFGQKDKVAGFAYSDLSTSQYSEEISEMNLLTESWPSKESIIALQPDIIYSIASAFRDDKTGSLKEWNDKGIPVITTTNFTLGRTIEAYFNEISTFGQVFDIEKDTDSFINEQQTRIDSLQEITKDATTTPSVLVIGVSKGTYYYYAPQWAMIDEMVEGSHATYMEMSDEDYIELSTEAILAANPDKIIITEFQQPDREVTKQELLDDKRLANISAIKNNDILVAEYTSAINGGLELVDLYEEVAQFIHPDLFNEERK